MKFSAKQRRRYCHAYHRGDNQISSTKHESMGSTHRPWLLGPQILHLLQSSPSNLHGLLHWFLVILCPTISLRAQHVLQHVTEDPYVLLLRRKVFARCKGQRQAGVRMDSQRREHDEVVYTRESGCSHYRRPKTLSGGVRGLGAWEEENRLHVESMVGYLMDQPDGPGFRRDFLVEKWW